MGIRIHSQSGIETTTLEEHFNIYREATVGRNHRFTTPYGKQSLLYADWAASGRLYSPIESKLLETLGPLTANPHTESNWTGAVVTQAYEQAKSIVKRHVNAGPEDILLFAGYGMTSAVAKLQRLLGLRAPSWMAQGLKLQECNRPIVFVTHMEHHSNQLSWAETIADVVMLRPGRDGEVSPTELERMLQEHQHRKCKIGAFTAASNVTGRRTPYRALARKMHEYGGWCFVDFAASAPYEPIDMHPEDAPQEYLDAVLFSPHKFLGGPGASGVLVMNRRLCADPIPDQPGGGTVLWTDPWGGRTYIHSEEAREDGGTPGFLQAIKAAQCVLLKESMGAKALQLREQELTHRLIGGLRSIPQVSVLERHLLDRIGIVSFTVSQVHYNLVVKLLSDRFGIQARGGCSCAGPYGHYLLGISQEDSKSIREQVITGDLSSKPGWVRLSLHPTMTNAEVDTIIQAIRQIVQMNPIWRLDYRYDPAKNEWHHNEGSQPHLDSAAILEELYSL